MNPLVGYNNCLSTPIDQIRQLPVAEQLAIVEQIWDGLQESPELVQAWQMEEARRRAKQLESGEATTLSEDEVWQQVDELLE